MKKGFLIIIISLFSLRSISQNSMIIYYSISINDMERVGILYASIKDNSYYVEKFKKNKEADKITAQEDNSTNIKSYSNIDVNKEYIQVYKNNIINNYDFIGNKRVQYLDTTNKINWEIKNEFKVINKYKCTKAVCNFRGRNYTAWFSPDIPIVNGPWKFHGLPGLIFQIADDTGAYDWVVDKIKFISTIPQLQNDLQIEKLGFKDFVNKSAQIYQKESNEKMEILLSKLSLKNANIKTKQVVFQRGRELVYDWEKE